MHSCFVEFRFDGHFIKKVTGFESERNDVAIAMLHSCFVQSCLTRGTFPMAADSESEATVAECSNGEETVGSWLSSWLGFLFDKLSFLDSEPDSGLSSAEAEAKELKKRCYFRPNNFI